MSVPGHPLLAAPLLAAPFLAAVLLVACLPRDDLSSYASNSVGQGGADGNEADASSAGSAGLQGQSGNPGEITDPNLPLDGDRDAAAPVLDAGVPDLLDASPAVDSGTLDAG